MPGEEPPPPLGDRVANIRERLEQIVQQINLRGFIEAHPWELVGAAVVFGAWIGSAGPRVKRSRLREAVVTAAGALAIKLAREAAFRHVGTIAMQWWDESGSKVSPDREPETGRENGRSDRGHA